MEDFLNWDINKWAFDFISSVWGDNGFSKISSVIGVIGFWWIIPAVLLFFIFGTDSEETEKVFFNDGSEGHRHTGKVIKGDTTLAVHSAINWMLFYPFGLVYFLLIQNITTSITGNSDIDTFIKWGVLPICLIIVLVIIYTKKIKPKRELKGILIMIFLGLMSIPLLVWVITLIGSLVKYMTK